MPSQPESISEFNRTAIYVEWSGAYAECECGWRYPDEPGARLPFNQVHFSWVLHRASHRIKDARAIESMAL